MSRDCHFGRVPSNSPNLRQTSDTALTHSTAMSEGTRPKYDNLPGIDTAPDIYETPELAEDVSTIQASTAVSESDGEGDDDDPRDSAVRHQRLQPDQARSRFQPSRIDARGVDFSDNITAQRQSYRTSTQRQRRRGEIIGDDSDEEDTQHTRAVLGVHRRYLIGRYKSLRATSPLNPAPRSAMPLQRSRRYLAPRYKRASWSLC